MNVLIAAEKPSISRAIAPAVRKHWPDADIVFVHVVPYATVGYSYPRGLKWHEFPLVSEPVDRLAPWAEWPCPLYRMSAGGALSSGGSMDSGRFTAADLIVCACDPDHTGTVAFDVLMRQVFGDERARDCPALMLQAFDEAAIERALADLRPFGQACSASLAYGRVKRYFDWNWNVNGLAILGEAQRRVGVAAGAPPLSKYALQLLYALRHRPPQTDGTVVGLMQAWPGTGRYTAQPGSGFPRMGSPASRLPIIDNLGKAGLLDWREVSGRHALSVSERGHALLGRLHPGCEDADLPFRLHAWCEQGEDSKPAIDRYIKTFFGKQKRFMQ
ncbi:hypothetical protein [Burkholderia ambifaria]|uniref:hypothetical protein n=1 Tax=Burkholderia ambifaria TaxID=152480 RepID=UPI000F805A64|nr:hypothetical protein [Burkholderia ambifaria]